MTRLTFTADNGYPMWSPDGESVLFSSTRDGTESIYQQDADGAGGAELLTAGEFPRHPDAVSQDGTALAFHEHHGVSGWDMWTLPLDDGDPSPFHVTEFDEGNATFSPDGRWLAYQSGESGRPEIYATPFPDLGEKILISTNGGGGPIWSRDGREIFYREVYRTMSVAVALEAAQLVPSAPQFLFEADTQAPEALGMSNSCVARTIVTWRRKTTAKRRWTSTAVRPTSCVNRRSFSLFPDGVPMPNSA